MKMFLNEYNFNNFDILRASFDYDDFEIFFNKKINENTINNFNNEIIKKITKAFENFYLDLKRYIDRFNNSVIEKKNYIRAKDFLSNLFKKYEHSDFNTLTSNELKVIKEWQEKGEEIHLKHNLKNICLYCSQKRNLTNKIKDNIC